ncbi:serine hydrolase [Nostoc sp. FACHB-110]|uniref:serine hydrolase n=1 Tax=Nostoc sp. FACHB-110 TaxID=2692834 RepID=UPI00168A00EC|nr:serine hydrolase [Nostoc sp. FACHB-110]MBD2439118.1 serine hydrolase [Nostoc sp. FACHB-110]
MTESSDKLRDFSRRQPVNRRQRSRKVQKVEAKKAKAPNPQQRPVVRESVLVPQPASAGVPRPRQGLVMPTAVKPIPKTPRNIAPANPSTVKVKTVRVQKQPPPQLKRTKKVSKKTRLKPMARTMLYILRLLIVGVGMGAIVGTVLSVLDPASRINSTTSVSSNTSNNAGQVQPQATPNQAVTTSGLYLSQENTSLKNAVQELATTTPDMTPGVFLVDLDNGSYVDINASTSFPAASTIKVPVLVAFFQDVDAGKIRLDEMLTMQQDMVAGGSGNFQFKPVGTQYTALEVATKMITISDNTATNMLIARLGGIEALNQRFRSWGLTTTAINNKLPDLQGTNITSPKELGNLMAMVNQGNFVSMRSRDLMLDIMRRTERDTLLPSGLDSGARIYHKTGDIGTMLADTGLVDVPNGKRYIISVMVKRPNNDVRAEKLISSISRIVYQNLSQSSATNNTTVPTTTTYPAPNITSPIPNTTTGVMPITGYQSPMLNPAIPNSTVNIIPPSGYQSPQLTSPQYYQPR